MNTDSFETFQNKSNSTGKRQGCFVRVHTSSPDTPHRRLYISAEALERLGDPRYIEYHIDHENRRLAISKATKGNDHTYSIPETSQSVAVELPLRALHVKETEGRRLKAQWLEEPEWLVIDFMGGADDAEA